MVKVVYSERETTDFEYQAPYLYQRSPGRQAYAQAAREHELHPNLIGNGHAYTQEAKIAELERLIGQQTVKISLLKKS